MADGINNNTKLMLHLNDNFTDDSPLGKAVSTSGSPRLTASKFGNGSLYFNGADEYLTIPDSDAFNFFENTTDDWTIDYWLKADSIANPSAYIISHMENWQNFWASGYSGWGTYLQPRFTCYIGNSEKVGLYSSVHITDTDWHHIAIIKVGNDIGLYVDGVRGANQVDVTDTVSFNGVFYIGAAIAGSSDFKGNLDEIRIQKSNAFSADPTSSAPITVPTSEYSADANTKLLLHLDSDAIIDEGGSPSHIVTANGSPIYVDSKFGNGCANFDGTDDYLTIPYDDSFAFYNDLNKSTMFDFWFKSSNYSSKKFAYHGHTTPSIANWELLGRGTGELSLRNRDAGGYHTSIETAEDFSDNQWHHCAVIIKGTGTTFITGLYIDGNRKVFQSDSTIINPGTLDNLNIGSNSTGTQTFDGSMDEVRIQLNHSIDPSVDATITVPTSEYTADANTKLLMHFNDSFEDSSDIGHSVSVMDDTLLTAKKFGLSSMNFNGVDQYLSVPDSDDWDIFNSISDSVTIDFWVKQNSSGAEHLCGQFQDYSNRWYIFYNAGSGLRYSLAIGGTWYMDGTYTPEITNDEWHHIAFVRIANKVAIYIDGEQEYYYEIAVTASFNSPLYIGQQGDGTSQYTGTMDEFRVQKSNAFSASPNSGKTNTITVPIAEHTPDSDTKLLLHLNGNANDSAGDGHPVTNNGAENISPKFGNGCAYLGSGDYLSVSDSDDWRFDEGTGQPFTIDFWVNFDSVASNVGFFGQDLGDSSNYIGGYWTTSNLFYFRIFISSSQVLRFSAPFTPNANTWYHITLERIDASNSANGWKVFIDGTEQTLTLTSGAWNGTIPNLSAVLFVGKNHSWTFPGKIDEFRISKGIARWTSNFTPETSEYTTDANTKLLMHLNGDISDSSGKDHQVIPAGDAKIDSAKFGTGSLVFDGVDDYLSIPDSDDWDIASSPSESWTIDVWVRISETLPLDSYIITQKQDSNNQWFLRIGSGDRVVCFGAYGNPYVFGSIYASSAPLSIGTWHHIAVIIDNGKCGLYINGVREVVDTSMVGTLNCTAELQIGAQGGSIFFKGHMDELRIQKSNIFGVDPSVDTTITVPTSAHTADADTKLLMHFNGDISDSGGKDHTVTKYGNTTIVSGKFGDGAGYFDGSGDYLAIPDSDDFNILNSAFTIDFWFNTNVASNTGYFYYQGNSAMNANSVFQRYSSGTKLQFYDYDIATGGYKISIVCPFVPVLGQWHHIAFVRVNTDNNSSAWRIFVDGVSQPLTLHQGAWNPAIPINNYNQPIYIAGMSAGGGLPGTLDEVRVSNMARWTSNFTPETSAYSSDANTMLLLHLDELPIVDSSDRGHTATVFSSPRFTDFKFGDASCYLDGDNDYLTIPDSDAFDFSDEDFTIDFWIKFNSVSAWMSIYNYSDGVSSSDRACQIGTNGSDEITARIYESTTQYKVESTTIMGTGQWYHIAFIRNGNDLNLYINGVPEGGTTNVTGVTVNTVSIPLEIGHDSQAGFNVDFNGNIDEYRISNIARWVADFSASLPTSEYTADANTKLLMHFDSDLNDESDIGHAVTKNGDVGFVPQLGSGCAYFNGTSDYLQLANSDAWDIVKYSTDDWTIDLFVKHSNHIGSENYVHQGNTTDWWTFRHIHGTGLNFKVTVASSPVIDLSGGEIIDTDWHHVSIIKVGSNYGLYLDGSQVAHTDDSSTTTFSGALLIGVWQTPADSLFAGHMDELRIQNSNPFSANPTGAVTDTITVPSVQHTADANTKLLLHMDSDFTDTSEYGHGVATHNDPIFTYTKFGTGSMYLDGSGDYLSIPDSDDFDIFKNNTDSYTIDFWAKFSDYTDPQKRLIGKWQQSPLEGWYLSHEVSSNGFYFEVYTGNSQVFTEFTNVAITDIDWHHITIVVIGSGSSKTFGLYLDGTQIGYATTALNANNNVDLNIGCFRNGVSYFNGYMDEVRIQKSNAFSVSPNVGKTNTFTPPTSAHTADADTKLLLHLNEDFSDSSGADHTVTVNNDTKLVGQKFGSHALDLNGTSQYLEIPDSDAWDIFGSNSDNWTVDCWVKVNDLSHWGAIFQQYQGPANSYYNDFYYGGSSGYLLVFLRGPSSTILEFQTPNNTINDNDWHHVALIKKADEYGIYVDGVQLVYKQSSVTQSLTAPFSIGGSIVTNYLNGAMDEFRVQKSNAFSASPNVGLTNTITIPTVEHIADEDTVLLLHLNGDATDSALTPHTVTEVNDPATDYYKWGNGAIYFDGTDDYLSLSDSDDWDIVSNVTDSTTIDFWVKHADHAGQEHYITQCNSAGNAYWKLHHVSGEGLEFMVKSGGSVKVVTGRAGEISDTDWHHIAVVIIGNGVTNTFGIYLDGEQVNYVQSSNTATFAEPLYIGTISYLGNPSESFAGYMDEVRIQKSNYFSASPNVGLTNTITIPTEQYELEFTPSTGHSQSIIIT